MSCLKLPRFAEFSMGNSEVVVEPNEAELTTEHRGHRGRNTTINPDNPVILSKKSLFEFKAILVYYEVALEIFKANLVFYSSILAIFAASLVFFSAALEISTANLVFYGGALAICKAHLVFYEVALVFSKKSLVFYDADLEKFMERLVFYAVGFVGEINHLKIFATFLGGRSMSVVQGLAHHDATAPHVIPRSDILIFAYWPPYRMETG